MTTKDLIDLIHQNTRVILPEFGAFLIKESGDKGFIPSNLTFSPFLRYNDGMVEVYIAKSKGVSKDEASKLVHNFIDQIKNDLEEKGAFHIEGLGFLRRDSRGSTTFVLGDNVKPTKTTEKVSEQPPKDITAQTKPVETTPVIEEKKDLWADETSDEPRVEAQKKFRRIGGKRAQVEKLTISRIPINKDLLNSLDGQDGGAAQEQEEVRSMFVPVDQPISDETKLSQEIIQSDVVESKSDISNDVEPKEIANDSPAQEAISELDNDPKLENKLEKVDESPEPVQQDSELEKKATTKPTPKKGTRGRKKKVESEIIERIEDAPIEKTEEIQIVSDEPQINASATDSKGELIELEATTEPEEVVESAAVLEEIPAKEVIAETSTSYKPDEKESEPQKPEVKKPVVYERYEDDSSSSILITLGIIVGVVVLFFVGRYLFFSSKTEISADSLNRAQTIVEDSISNHAEAVAGSEDDIDKTFNELDNSKEGADNQNEAADVEQRKTEEAIAQGVINNTLKAKEGVNFYLIVGSFKNLDYAKNFADKISKSGIKTEIVLQKSGMHAVSIGVFKTRAEAAEKQTSILDKYPGAWILKQ